MAHLSTVEHWRSQAPWCFPIRRRVVAPPAAARSSAGTSAALWDGCSTARRTRWCCAVTRCLSAPLNSACGLDYGPARSALQPRVCVPRPEFSNATCDWISVRQERHGTDVTRLFRPTEVCGAAHDAVVSAPFAAKRANRRHCAIEARLHRLGRWLASRRPAPRWSCTLALAAHIRYSRSLARTQPRHVRAIPALGGPQHLRWSRRKLWGAVSIDTELARIGRRHRGSAPVRYPRMTGYES